MIEQDYTFSQKILSPNPGKSLMYTGDMVTRPQTDRLGMDVIPMLVLLHYGFTSSSLTDTFSTVLAHFLPMTHFSK